MDEADRAEAQEQQWRDLAIAAIRDRPIEAVVVVTHCLNCGEVLKEPPIPNPSPARGEGDKRGVQPPPRRWCDADCRLDWERRQR